MSLHVLVIACKNLKSMDTFGKNDVYVEVSLGELSQRTTTKEDAGETAEFNESFELYVLLDLWEVEYCC